MDFYAAYPAAHAFRQDGDLVADFDRATPRGAGDHRARPRKTEYAVDRHPKEVIRRTVASSAEVLVAGDVQHARHDLVVQREVREAQVNGDPAALLFGKPVGVRPRERLDQGGLAMVNVARGADDHMLHHGWVSQKARAGSAR